MTDPRNALPPHQLSMGVAGDKKVIRKESSDDYTEVLIEFFADWRLILCKYSSQWIVQARSAKRPNKGVWVGKTHVTTKAALLVACSALHLVRDISVAQKVLALPDKVTGGSQNG